MPENRVSRRDFLKLVTAATGGMAILSWKNQLNRAGSVSEFAEELSSPVEPITPGRVLEWIRPVSVKAGPFTVLGMAYDAYVHKMSGKEEIEVSDLKGTAIGVGAETLTGCSPKPEGEPPTAEQIDEVTAQATALPEELNPLLNSTPAALEVIPTTEPERGKQSVINGLNMGLVGPGNYVGMVPNYESTGVVTLYDPNDSPEPIIKQGETTPTEAIPPRAYGIDQEQLITYFNASPDSDGFMVGKYKGVGVTLKNGMWTTMDGNGDAFIPFSKVYKDQKAAVVMTAEGKLQKVNVVDGTKIGAAFPMFQTPQAIFEQLYEETADYQPGNMTFNSIKPANVVGVEMNPNGSLTFITKEPRPTEAKPDRTVQVVNEVAFLGEPEDWPKDEVIVKAADEFLGSTPAATEVVTREELLKKGYIVRNDEGKGCNEGKGYYELLYVPSKKGDRPIAIKAENAKGGKVWEVVTPRNLGGKKRFLMGSTTMPYEILPYINGTNGSKPYTNSEYGKNLTTYFGGMSFDDVLKPEFFAKFGDGAFRDAMHLAAVTGTPAHLANIFYHQHIPPNDIRELEPSSPGFKSEVEKSMRKRLKWVFKHVGGHKPTIITLNNEALATRREGDRINYAWEKSKYYEAFGTDLFYETLKLAYEEAEAAGLKPGEDVYFANGLYLSFKDDGRGTNVMLKEGVRQTKQAKQRFANERGIPIDEVAYGITTQYRVSDKTPPSPGRGSSATKEEMIRAFAKQAECGKVWVVEAETISKEVGKPIEYMTTMIEAAVAAGVEGVYFWNGVKDYERANLDPEWDNPQNAILSFTNGVGHPNDAYYEYMNALANA